MIQQNFLAKTLQILMNHAADCSSSDHVATRQEGIDAQELRGLLLALLSGPTENIRDRLIKPSCAWL